MKQTPPWWALKILLVLPIVTAAQAQQYEAATNSTAVENLFWEGARGTAVVFCERLITASEISLRKPEYEVCTELLGSLFERVMMLQPPTLKSSTKKKRGWLQLYKHRIYLSDVSLDGNTDSGNTLLSHDVVKNGFMAIFEETDAASELSQDICKHLEKVVPSLRCDFADLTVMLMRHLPLASAFGHFIHAMQSSVSARQPFTHVIIDNIFAPSIYQALIGAIPHVGDPAFSATSYPGQDNGGVKMLKINPNQSIFGSAAGLAGQPDPLPAVFDWIHSDLFLSLLSRVLHISRSRSRYVSARLMRDWPGYEISPHPDRGWKMASFFIYLPRNYSLVGRNLSTQRCTLKAKPPKPLNGGDEWEAWENFDCDDTGYIPNRLFAFRVEHQKSFHAVYVDPSLNPPPEQEPDAQRLSLRGHVIDFERAKNSEQRHQGAYMWHAWQDRDHF